MANPVMQLWHRASRWPGGQRVFSMMVARRAPYFGTVKPRVTSLEPNRCTVVMRKRRTVQNHIGTVHVIAICNLLEMAMGVCAEASVPRHLRWIPKGMSVDYVAKAGTDITATAEIDPDAWAPGDLSVKVTATDTDGNAVVEGHIRLWITERPAA